MKTTPEESWSSLAEALSGSLTARARGLLASEFVLLNQRGEDIGRLRLQGSARAELEAGDLRAVIERAPGSRHRMLTGDALILAAESLGSPITLEIRCMGSHYEAHLSLLRNTAVARSSGGEEAARVTGGLTNRNYKAVFDPKDEGSLPVAVFLLYHTVALGRRAYLMGTEG